MLFVCELLKIHILDVLIVKENANRVASASDVFIMDSLLANMQLALVALVRLFSWSETWAGHDWCIHSPIIDTVKWAQDCLCRVRLPFYQPDDAFGEDVIRVWRRRKVARGGLLSNNLVTDLLIVL